tara:strand:- start:364 stop:798 length:435 start_codon:yes stop_codon:yes gene_type:complete
MNEDYLKYWRVIRYFIKAKYGLTQADLDMLLFLKSERYFDKAKFDEFDNLMSWDKDRFKLLLRDGWIQVFRKRNGPTKTIYNLSYKAKRVINSIYKKLNGEEIPMSSTKNPLFAKNVKYTDKVYRNFIIEMNDFIRQQRHRAPE